MDVEYRRDMNHNYMIVKGIGPSVPEDYETRVISTNRIPGLLLCRMQYIDAETWYSYDVTSLQRLTVFCESRKIGKKELVRILSEILQILEGLEDYLLDFQHLILQPSSIYMDFETMELRLMYVPFYRKDIRRSLRELTEYLLGCTDHSDQSAIVLGYRFCHEVQENNTQLGDLIGVLCGETYGRQEGDASGGAGSYMEAAGGLSGEGMDRTFPKEEPRKNADPAAFDERGMADGEADSSPGSFGQEDGKMADGKKGGILTVISKPAVIVVGIALAIYAAVYVLLHTNLKEYVSMYTVCGICAAMSAAALAVYLIRNKRNQGKTERRDAGTAYVSGGERGDFRTEKMPDPVPQEMNNVRLMENEESAPGPNADGFGEMTVLLSSYRPETGPEDRWLLPVSEGFEPRHLSGDDLLIGKQQPFVDMAIDSPAVSRIHARLRFRAGRYFLEDLSSRNGTTLNDEPVCGNEERVLTEGDVIAFADVAYIFSQTESGPHCENAAEGV